jgi:RNA polymerase sigma-70 factor (ECF subfamily)
VTLEGVADGETDVTQRRAAAAPRVLDFASWYSAEHPKVLAVLSAVSGDPEAAREATDEAFARCFSRWNAVREMASPSGWTYRVALNGLRRIRRRRTLERRLLARLPPSRPVTDPVIDETWVLLGELSPRQRTATVLRYVADLPEADIAVVMGVTRGTVASTLADARRRMFIPARTAQQEETRSDG